MKIINVINMNLKKLNVQKKINYNKLIKNIIYYI